MYIPFEELPDRSRIWIYQANRPLSDQETTDITKKAQQFVNDWTSHGQTLEASVKVVHNRFLILAANEDISSPSGCSIDASSQFIRELEQAFNVGFFDRTQLLFLQNDKPQPVTLPDLRSKINEGAITADTLFFDNLVKTTGELQASWLKPAGKTWLAKYFEAN